MRQARLCGRFFDSFRAHPGEGFSIDCKQEIRAQESEFPIPIPARTILPMPVTFQIPGALREFSGGNAVIEISSSPTVVGDALRALCAQYPGIRDRIATEQWELRQHINVFVGDENIRFTGGLATRIKDGVTISIVPAISGGSN